MQEHSAQVYYDPHDPRVQLPGNAILCVGLDDSRPIIIDGKTRKTDVSFAALYDLGFTYESNKVFRRFDQGPHIRRYDWVRVALGKEQAKQGDTYHVFVVPTRSCVAGCMVWACNPIPFNHRTVFASFDTELLADQTAISALRTAHPILPPAPTPPAKVKARKTKAKRATPTETTAKDASSSTGQAEEQPQVKKRRRNATQAAEGQAEGKAKKVKKGKKSKEVAVEGEVKAVEEQVGQAVPEGPVTDPKPVIEGEAKKAEDSMQAVDRATEDAVGTAGEEGADSISKETTEKAVGGIKGTALSAHTV